MKQETKSEKKQKSKKYNKKKNKKSYLFHNVLLKNKQNCKKEKKKQTKERLKNTRDQKRLRNWLCRVRFAKPLLHKILEIKKLMIHKLILKK